MRTRTAWRSWRWSFFLSALLFSQIVVADEPARLTIRAVPDAPWGGDPKNVEQVLYSAAEALWRNFSERTLPVIVVEPKGGPIVLYQRGPEGQIRVQLATGDRLWAQHAFQFAHEFCHVLCGYEPCEARHQWFEESLCELASLVALRRMSETWKTDPPYPNWREYAAALDAYAQERIDGAQLPAGHSLAGWYRAHAAELAANPTARDHNTIVAVALLPLLEKSPEQWRAVEHLNDDGVKNAGPFAEFLARWRKCVREKDQPFVDEVAKELGLEIR